MCGVGAGKDGDTLLVPGPGRRHHVAGVVVIEAALDELRRVRLVDVAVCRLGRGAHDAAPGELAALAFWVVLTRETLKWFYIKEERLFYFLIYLATNQKSVSVF